jgi:hypothetical protein
VIVVHTDSGGCASNQRSTAGSTAMRIFAYRTSASTSIIKCCRPCRLTTPFENVLFKPDIAELSAQALAERLGFLRLAPDGLAQKLAHLLFSAPTVLFRTLLELQLYIVVEVPNHHLSRDYASSYIYDIATSRPCCRFAGLRVRLPPDALDVPQLPQSAGNPSALARLTSGCLGALGDSRGPAAYILL